VAVIVLLAVGARLLFSPPVPCLHEPHSD